jgi:hypothetical protein
VQAEQASIVARGFEALDGSSYFALPVKGSAQQARGPQDIVLLVDTSASQIGDFRTQGLAVTEAFLGGLRTQDRVRVIAVDVGSTPLTDGFVSGEQASKDALSKLKTRFPAGSTNLGAAIGEAAKSISGERAGAIVYIGDGMSTAALIQPAEMEKLTSTLRSRQIPVHSISVGSKVDLQVLGILAEHTGGVVVRDQVGIQAADLAKSLNTAVAGGVEYPASLTVSWTGGQVEPAVALPLRSDRSTVYLGRGAKAETAKLQLGETTWQVADAKVSPGYEFLAPMWRQAKQTHGVSVALAGDDLVAAAQQAFLDEIESLEARGERALKARDLKTAEQIGFSLKAAAPNNAAANRLINGANIVLAQAEAPAPGLETPPAPGLETPPPPAPGIDPLNSREVPSGNSAIQNVEAARAAREQKLGAEVQTGIEEAQRIGQNDASGAIAYLEQLFAHVKASTDIDKQAYERLVARVRSALTQARNEKEVREQTAQAISRKEIELTRKRNLVDAQTLKNSEIERRVDRIRALMQEGFAGNASAFEEGEVIARQVLSDDPGSALGVALVFTTEAAGQIDKVERLRAIRYDRFLETMYQAELAHVPFPDEPPVRYPPAEVWQNLTQLRAKWRSVDLHRNSPNEERIHKALSQNTDLEFPDNTLKEVMDYLAQIHNIPIKFDQTVIDAGVNPEEAKVSLTLSGITLRSALKIMLENVDGQELTYIIEDEIMKIVTREAADEKRTTRVYPVGDLVIQVMPLGGGFGGGALGGGQGQQGGGLGNGGGQGGGGGGGFGGGGQGGGGNLFSVPAVEVDAPAVELKKKP